MLKLKQVLDQLSECMGDELKYIQEEVREQISKGEDPQFIKSLPIGNVILVCGKVILNDFKLFYSLNLTLALKREAVTPKIENKINDMIYFFKKHLAFKGNYNAFSEDLLIIAHAGLIES